MCSEVNIYTPQDDEGDPFQSLFSESVSPKATKHVPVFNSTFAPET